MPSHFSTIGFPLNSEADFLALANRLAEKSEMIDVPDGRYLRWSSQTGAEIWLQLDSNDDLIGMVPHFAGPSRVRVGLTAQVTRPDDTALDGAFHGWAHPSDDDPEVGDYPFVFDTPDFRRHTSVPIPSIVTAQIAAFAHEISIFESIDAYDASGSGEPQLASQSFIPSGLFKPGGEATEPPEAYGILTGHIVQAAEKRNELSGEPFYWALVDSLGGTFDVVIDPELMDQALKIGGVLSGSFWLSGCLMADAKSASH